MNPAKQEYVHKYTFDVGDGEFVTEMVTIAASEDEAVMKIQNRLTANNMVRPIKLSAVKQNIAVRSKSSFEAKAS